MVVSLAAIYDCLMKLLQTLNIKQMCELIFFDIWQFLCNSLDENDRKQIRKLAAKEIEPAFGFRTENRISGFQLISKIYKYIHYIYIYIYT